MTNRRPAILVRWLLGATAVTVVTVATGCAPVAGPGDTDPAPGIASAAATASSLATDQAPSPSSLASTEPAASTDPGADPGREPPSAALAAEGGEPVIGQLGTFNWRDGGSASPWLPGAPIAVGPGEPMAVLLEPPVGVLTWEARIAPADGDDADAARLGSGTGQPMFAAPGDGSWTVSVRVDFAAGLGSANYYWRLDVV